MYNIYMYLYTKNVIRSVLETLIALCEQVNRKWCRRGACKEILYTGFKVATVNQSESDDSLEMVPSIFLSVVDDSSSSFSESGGRQLRL